MKSPYDLRFEPKLLSAQELDFIRTLPTKSGDPGRYTFREPFFLEDTESETSDAHLLSFEDILALRRNYVDEFIKTLGPAQPGTKLTVAPKLRSEAWRVLMERQNELTPEQRRSLAAALERPVGKIPSGAKFTRNGPQILSGAGTIASQIVGNALGQAVTTQQRSKLSRTLKTWTRGTTADRKKLGEILDVMLQSDTAAKLVQDFINEGANVEIRFGDYPGSYVTETSGVKELWGLQGTTTYGNPKIVKVNRKFLTTNPDHKATAGTMAHELVGHAYRATQAQKKGYGWAYSEYINDETNARIVGWVVAAEVGARLKNSTMWSYLSNKPAYYRDIGFISTNYTKRLSLDEMKDPKAAYRKRLAEIPQRKSQVVTNTARYEDWRRIIRRFNSDPRLKTLLNGKKLDRVSEYTENYLTKWGPKKTTRLGEVESRLRSRINGQTYSYGSAPTSSFFKGLESDMVDLEQRLRDEILARGATRSNQRIPWPSDQLTWTQLRELYKQNKAAVDGNAGALYAQK